MSSHLTGAGPAGEIQGQSLVSAILMLNKNKRAGAQFTDLTMLRILINVSFIFSFHGLLYHMMKDWNVLLHDAELANRGEAFSRYGEPCLLP